MGRIGLFGGTFDPPHKAHIELARKVLTDFSLDKVIFIPAGNPPHKQKCEKTDKLHRFNMVKLAVSDEDKFLVSDYDLNNKNPNYSYLTIGHFKEMHPDDEIFFIIGADSLRDFPFWKNYKELLTLCKFIVVPRPNVPEEDYYKNFDKDDDLSAFVFVKDFSYDLSSTDLRKNLTKDELPDGVYEYIKENRLYPKST